MLQEKIGWKHDTGKMCKNNETLEGTFKTQLQEWTSTVCFTSKLTVQFGYLANLQMVLCHYQHKQSCGTLRRSVR